MQKAVSQTNVAPPTLSSFSTAIYNGITLSLLEAPFWLSLLAIMFSGEMSGYIGRASLFLIVGAILSSTVIGLFSSWRGTMAMPQDVPLAVLVVMGARIFRDISAETTPDILFATIMATIAASSMTTGILFYLLGTFKLGNLVRYLPFPVLGGFLGGTGWLLLTGGISASLPAEQLGGYFEPAVLLYWLPAVGLALVIYLMGLRIKHALLVPALMLGAIALFFGITFSLGYSLEQLTNAGWLIGGLPVGNEPRLFTTAELSGIRWDAILANAGSIAVLAVASAIAMLLNTSGFELSIKTDIDPNRDLRVTGIANILCGFVGGWPTYMSPAWSAVNAKDAKEVPWTGLTATVIAGVLLWYATQLLAYMPRLVAGATVIYIGVVFLVDWVIVPAKRMPRVEYLMLLMIVTVIALFGFLQGVAAGLVVAIILFVISYSRVNVVRHALSGKHQRSRVTRASTHHNHLHANGDEIQLLQLHGYLFFGTANRLLEQVRDLIEHDNTRHLVIDFERVTGIDSTARLSFAKMQQLAADNGCTLALTQIQPKSAALIKQELSAEYASALQLFDSADSALESAENQQLRAAGFNPQEALPSLKEQLQAILPHNTNIEQLLSLMEKQEHATGDTLMQQDSPPSDMYFIESGTLTAQLTREDGPVVRLETMGCGRVVGELGFYLNQPRTADVVSDAPSVVYCLTKERLASIEASDPAAASTLHQLIVHLVSQRVTHLVGVVDALQR